ncbi:MAG TPA: IS1595 family transposase [Terracidiphilus sp.]|nr:IS1595 family transposase [Terracidiphilus sp.]
MPKTLKEAIEFYSNEQTCIDTVAMLRWPEGKPVCPKCGAVEQERKHYWLDSQKRWKCYACRKQFSVKVNSVFEDSPLPLSKWLMSMWMLVNCKNGVSSHEIARAIGISQKAAWHLLHRIRHVLGTTPETMMGGPGCVVSCDETYVGGLVKFMHRSAVRKRFLGMPTSGNSPIHKTPVFGMHDRETRQVRATVVPNVNRETLQNAILENVHKKTTVHTDQWRGYETLAAKDFIHETVNHMQEFVRGQVHTQAMENFWSLLKRGLKGTYVAVEPYHLDRYVQEQVFRFNNRATKENPLTDADRFTLALSQVAGKRLQFKELTGKVSGSC